MKLGSSVALLLVIGTITACRPPDTPPAPAPDHIPLPVSASFGKTWNAVIDVFAQGNIPIKTIDRSSGFLVAEQARVDAPDDPLKPFNLADCGSDVAANRRGRIYYHPTSAVYNIVVRGDSTTSTVRVTATYNMAVTPDVKLHPCESTGVFETSLEREIKQLAESK